MPNIIQQLADRGSYGGYLRWDARGDKQVRVFDRLVSGDRIPLRINSRTPDVVSPAYWYSPAYTDKSTVHIAGETITNQSLRNMLDRMKDHYLLTVTIDVQDVTHPVTRKVYRAGFVKLSVQ